MGQAGEADAFGFAHRLLGRPAAVKARKGAVGCGTEAALLFDVTAGAILIDVGKLIEYVMADGQAVVGKTGALLRHPFSGVGLAMRFGVPDEICHMIATHSKEGDLGKRTTESLIIHHADFMSFEPFKAETLRP